MITSTTRKQVWKTEEGCVTVEEEFCTPRDKSGHSAPIPVLVNIRVSGPYTVEQLEEVIAWMHNKDNALPAILVGAELREEV